MASPVFRLTPQQHRYDCAVACLATLLGEDYDDVLQAFKHNVAARGATTKEILEAARLLKHTLRRVRTVTLDSMTGIVAFRSKLWKSDHVVVLKNELIFDPFDATLWDADDYVHNHKARALEILIEDDE